MFNFLKPKNKVDDLTYLLTTEADNGIKLFDLEYAIKKLLVTSDIVTVMKTIKSISSLPNGKHDLIFKDHRVLLTVNKGSIIDYKIYW